MINNKKIFLLLTLIFLFFCQISVVKADHCTECNEQGTPCGYCGYGCEIRDGICVENDNYPVSDNSEDTKWGSICSDDNIKQGFKIVGYIVQIIRWIVPLIIIVLGMVDFGKAAISNDDKSVSKASAALIRRIIAGIVVFFIPTIILAVLNLIEVSKGIEDIDNSMFGACTKCIVAPHTQCNTN